MQHTDGTTCSVPPSYPEHSVSNDPLAACRERDAESSSGSCPHVPSVSGDAHVLIDVPPTSLSINPMGTVPPSPLCTCSPKSPSSVRFVKACTPGCVDVFGTIISINRVPSIGLDTIEAQNRRQKRNKPTCVPKR